MKNKFDKIPSRLPLDMPLTSLYIFKIQNPIHKRIENKIKTKLLCNIVEHSNFGIVVILNSVKVVSTRRGKDDDE